MIRRLLFFATTFLFVHGLNAQYTIRDPDAIPLHGAWSFTIDPLDAGVKEEWYLSTKNFKNWDKVDVPHCFSVDPRYHYFSGPTWYRKIFQWEPTTGKRTILHFDGVYYKCTVWLNDKKVGEHEGGYTPFKFDISDKLKSGENLIVIQVDNNTWKEGTIPGAKNKGPNTQFPGWLNYGGITRPMYITVEPESYVENVKVEAAPDLSKKTAQLRTRIFIRKPESVGAIANPSLSIFLYQRKIAVSWKFVDNKKKTPSDLLEIEATASLKSVDVKLWSLDNPVCYQLQSVFNNDTVITTFGIRKVEVKNLQLLLNGEPIRVAGGNRVMDYPGLGSLEPDWLIEKDLRLMKETGMEFHRLTHYTTTEAVLDWADRNGMLIVAEAGNWQLTPEQMDNDTIRRKFRQQFEEMVKRDWNHPCLIAYSVGNEYLSDTPSGQRWTKDMIEFARQLDPTRLYTFATMRLSALPKNPEDEASQYVDFVSANIYGNQKAILDNIHRLYPDKPILISEYGKRVDSDGEGGQVEYLKNYLDDIRLRPYVIGASWWSYNDYRSIHWGTNKNGYRPWGLVNPDRVTRPLYGYHKTEMSPLAITKKHFRVGKQGNHELVLGIRNRSDFPSYATRNYTLKTADHQIAIPDLTPGQQVEVTIPVKGFDPSIKIEIIKPTGFSIVETNMDLNYD
jgi:beta-glucuronidase